MKRVLLAVTVLALGLSLGGSPREASAGPCNRNMNSELIDYGTSGWACGATGGGCDVCFYREPRSQGSWSLCYFSVRQGTEVCTHYM